jgi:hypothetical protein
MLGIFALSSPIGLLSLISEVSVEPLVLRHFRCEALVLGYRVNDFILLLTILLLTIGVETTYLISTQRIYTPLNLSEYEITILSSKSLLRASELTRSYELPRDCLRKQSFAFISDDIVAVYPAIHSHHLSRRNIPFLCR